MATNPFTTIRASAGSANNSMAWYQEQIRSLSAASLRPNNLLQNAPQLTTTILPGAMYLFLYDAKHKDILPHWDRFPLVLPFRLLNDGFLGINFHYMPYIMRFKLLEKLHNFANNKTINEKTRVKVSWQLLEGMTTIAPIKACVKHYLTSHVQSKFLNIRYPDWVTAALLPVERFVGAPKTTVWKISKETMDG